MPDALNFEPLRSAPRLLMEAELKPVQGDRFQPTGFADLGAAVYERADGTRMLLVESAQSVANRLEASCLEGGVGPGPIKELDGLPYVRVKLTGVTETETSSLVEAHRLNSPYIMDAVLVASEESFQAAFVEKAGYAKGKPLDWKSIAAAFFHFDPNSLLHGAFMENVDGRLRVPRAISGFIEAEGVREVAFGGVKNNPIDPSGTIRAAGLVDKDVYSNVPYHRTEFTAHRIVAYFNLDLALLRGYGLGDAAFELLVALGLYKVLRFLDVGLRLRTACDLALVNGIRVTAPGVFQLPTEKREEKVLKAVTDRIQACATAGLFAKPPVTELVVETVRKEKKQEKERSRVTARPDQGDENEDDE